MDDPEEQQAIQIMCPTCGTLHPPEYVDAISAGHKGCEHCMRPPGVLTVAEYERLLMDSLQLARLDFETPTLPGMAPPDTSHLRGLPRRPEPGDPGT